MEAKLRKLKEELEQEWSALEREGHASLTEFLCCYYLRNYPVDTVPVEEGIAELEPILCSLSRKRRRKITNVVVRLATGQEQEAFCRGFRVGARLMQELLDGDCLNEQDRASNREIATSLRSSQ